SCNTHTSAGGDGLRFFFFQAEDGIRDFHVTGVQTCALPIYSPADELVPGHLDVRHDEVHLEGVTQVALGETDAEGDRTRRARRSALHEAEVVAPGNVGVERKARLLGVEGSRPVDIGDSQEHELQFESHGASVTSTCRSPRPRYAEGTEVRSPGAVVAVRGG